MGEECNPSEFYQNSSFSLHIPVGVQYLNGLFIIFIYINAPFLIIMPFCAQRLKTNCRKIIAMIILSDSINTLNLGLKIQLKEQFEKDNFFGLCILTNLFQDITTQWSQMWSLLLIVNVLLTLQPIYGVNGTSRWFLRACHFIAWPYGVLLVTFSDGIAFFPVHFEDSYLFGASCQGDYKFELNEVGDQCLLAGGGLIITIFFYSFIIILLLISILLYLKTYYVARKQWKQSCERLLRNIEDSCPITQADDLDDGFEIAADPNKTVFKTTVRLSTTALIYVISILPLIMFQFYQIFNGPIRNKALWTFFSIWFVFIGNFIGVLNVILYGYLSPTFRLEMNKLKNRLLDFLFRTYYVIAGTRNRFMSSDDSDLEDDFGASLSSNGIGRESELSLSYREYTLR